MAQQTIYDPETGWSATIIKPKMNGREINNKMGKFYVDLSVRLGFKITGFWSSSVTRQGLRWKD